MDISSIYNQFNTNKASDNNAKALQNSLSTTDYSKANSDELMDVCKEFESYFVEQMFKSMKKMVPEDEDKSSSSSSTLDYFEDMLTQEYASSATKQGGFGIAEMLYEQMKRNYNITDVSDTFKS